jgi:imidazole glycerol-phosphate synthase subunit HisH
MSVAIIDYGSGNLRSAAKAFERAISETGLNLKVQVTNNPDDLARASHIVLPGVGAFGDCRHGLDDLSGMTDAMEKEVIQGGKPFLGICVGMQLLASYGWEHGKHKGLGWIPGEVVPITPSDPTLKIPHMGWNNLTFLKDHPVIKDISDGAHTYFVHSYQFSCKDSKHLLSTVDYGEQVTAMIARDNMVGTQFHPEKSQSVGLKLIANFLKWRP